MNNKIPYFEHTSMYCFKRYIHTIHIPCDIPTSFIKIYFSTDNIFKQGLKFFSEVDIVENLHTINVSKKQCYKLATFYAKIKIFYVIERNVEMQFILRFIKKIWCFQGAYYFP